MGRSVFRAYGRTVAVEAPADLLELIADRLPPMYRRVDQAPERMWRLEQTDSIWSVTSGGAFFFGVDDPVLAAEALLSDLELWVAEHAKGRICVHAGCAVVDGKAIVLPGRTLSGKSSLTAALVRAGATYYSDEFAVLDSRGQVRPYARKLSMRPYDGSAPVRTAVEELGGRPGRGIAKVGLVAALRFDREGEWQIKPVSRGEAILALIDNTVAAQSRPRAMLSALEGATAEATAITGTRGDADEAARHLLEML